MSCQAENPQVSARPEGVLDAGGPSRLWEPWSSAPGDTASSVQPSRRAATPPQLLCVCPLASPLPWRPWVLAEPATGRREGQEAQPGSVPAGSEPGREAPPRLEPLTQTLESRGPSRAGCTCVGLVPASGVAGPPTPRRGRRAGRGFRAALLRSSTSCTRKEGTGRAASPTAPVPGLRLSGPPHPPRPVPLLGPGLSGWGGWVFSLSGAPGGTDQGSWTMRPGPKGPSLRQPQHCPQQGHVPSGSGNGPSPALL